MNLGLGPATNVWFLGESHSEAPYLLRLLIAQLHRVVPAVEGVVAGCLVRAPVYHQLPCVLTFLHKAFP
jgi:hypothetical protein